MLDISICVIEGRDVGSTNSDFQVGPKTTHSTETYFSTDEGLPIRVRQSHLIHTPTSTFNYHITPYHTPTPSNVEQQRST